MTEDCWLNTKAVNAWFKLPVNVINHSNKQASAYHVPIPTSIILLPCLQSADPGTQVHN